MMPATAFGQGLFGGASFCIVLGLAGGLLTRVGPWYHNLRKPSWQPPDWSFGVVWTTVFIFITLAIAYAWSVADAAQRSAMIWVLAINGILNIAWSGIFFTMQKPQLAFYEVLVFWVSIIALIYVLGGISRTAGLLLLPYLIWVSIATFLNYEVVRLNPA